MFLHQVANLVHLSACIEIACGVVGVTNQDCAGAFVDEFFKLFDLRQRKAFFDGSGHGANARAGRDGEGHIVGVSRFGYDDFVAGIEARHESKEHRFGTARSDDDIVGRETDIVTMIVINQLATIGKKTL